MNAQKLFSKKWIVFATAVLCTLLWGSAFPGIKTGYRMFRIASQDTADQLMFAGARFLIAGILTLLISFFVEKKEHKKERRKQWPKGQIVLVAFVQTALQYVFYYIGMAHVTGVKGAILNGSTAFFCVVTACIFYHESINGRKIAGVSFGSSWRVCGKSRKREYWRFVFLFRRRFYALFCCVIGTWLAV